MSHGHSNHQLERLRGTLRGLLAQVERNLQPCLLKNRLCLDISRAIVSQNQTVMVRQIRLANYALRGMMRSSKFIDPNHRPVAPKEHERIDVLPEGPLTDDIIFSVIRSGRHAKSGNNRGKAEGRRRQGLEGDTVEGENFQFLSSAPSFLEIIDPVFSDMRRGGLADADGKLIRISGKTYVYAENGGNPELLGEVVREFPAREADAAHEYYRQGNEHFEKVLKYEFDESGCNIEVKYICFYRPIGEWGDSGVREKFNEEMRKKSSKDARS